MVIMMFLPRVIFACRECKIVNGKTTWVCSSKKQEARPQRFGRSTCLSIDPSSLEIHLQLGVLSTMFHHVFQDQETRPHPDRGPTPVPGPPPRSRPHGSSRCSPPDWDRPATVRGGTRFGAVLRTDPHTGPEGPGALQTLPGGATMQLGDAFEKMSF